MSKEGLKNKILIGVIAFLVIVVAIMGFFLGGMYMKGGDVKTPGATTNKNYEKVSVKVIKDSRDTMVDLEGTINSLKELPSLAKSEFTVVDFADKGVKEYMEQNNIKYLPAVIFSTNNFDTTKDPVQTNPTTGQPNPAITSYLVEIPSGEYSLLLGSEFDPFVERSEKGFTILSQENYDKLFADGIYRQGNKDSKITWLEFSELQCPYCAKLYNDGTPTKVKEKYGNDLSLVFHHFPLSFHENAETAAQILECLGEQKGADAFYGLVEKAFAEKKSDKEFLVNEAVSLGANKDQLEKCLTDGKYKDKVTAQMTQGVDIFGISGTPGNVLINNETREYQILNGAYPYEAFQELIDKLIK